MRCVEQGNADLGQQPLLPLILCSDGYWRTARIILITASDISSVMAITGKVAANIQRISRHTCAVRLVHQDRLCGNNTRCWAPWQACPRCSGAEQCVVPVLAIQNCGCASRSQLYTYTAFCGQLAYVHVNSQSSSLHTVGEVCWSCAGNVTQSRLALYVYEYLLHVGAQKSAQTFLSEIRWEKNITLGEPPGFLHSWWCVFWDLYCAAPERRETCEHSSEAKAFHDYSAAAAPSPVLGNIPPGDGMPVGPVPPGFFQ
ncbi:PREDICTED: uncharacterized protein LOC104566487, partial [Tinamus guttatus]|uniref:uncharacterized protein LOC104566487 n=1 Tax=Tinamus guttatus TaxID=94827 RepID=UPI00052EC97C